ncbi:hypothetical protein QEH57_23790 [Pelagicoccus sp. SDUM812005]|nr:hypothetical protein [Pelagicoccus sp. SDUM812005]
MLTCIAEAITLVGSRHLHFNTSGTPVDSTVRNNLAGKCDNVFRAPHKPRYIAKKSPLQLDIVVEEADERSVDPI